MKNETGHPALQTWIGLNDHIRTADEDECSRLLAAEKAGKNRRTFVHRIFCRLNRVRAERERKELGAK